MTIAFRASAQLQDALELAAQVTTFEMRDLRIEITDVTHVHAAVVQILIALERAATSKRFEIDADVMPVSDSVYL